MKPTQIMNLFELVIGWMLMFTIITFITSMNSLQTNSASNLYSFNTQRFTFYMEVLHHQDLL